MIKKLIVIFTSLIVIFTSLTGCSSKSEQSKNDSGIDYTQPQKYVYNDGIHDLTAPEINDKYILKNGKTEYKILMPSVVSEYLIVARDELVELFKEATGITLPIEVEDEDGKIHDENQKYFSIGNTKMFQSANISLNGKDLGTNGCRLVTKNNNVYFLGASDEGVVYAVYDFLSIALNYEWYDFKYWEIDKNVSNLKLRNFDTYNKPDFERRRIGQAYLYNNINNANYRARFNWEYWDNTMPIGDTSDPTVNKVERNVHNTPYWLPLNASTTKPEWISTQGVQLCYTVRGDETLYAEMVDRLVFVLTESLKKYPRDKYPQYDQATLTMEDEYPVVCDCTGCIAAKQKYGTDVGAVIVLCNNVMEKTRAWMDEKDENGNYVNEKYRREKFTLRFFAYSQFVKAPAHYDEEQGKYVVNHPDLIMRDDVSVWHAINSSMQYQLSVYSKENKEHLENSTAWFDISPHSAIWTYTVNYWEQMLMYDSFNFYTKDAYNWWKVKNVEAAMQEGTNSDEVTAFTSLKTYLASKLYWDCSLDEEELTDKWFNAMFKEAAPIMRKLFNDMRANAMSIWSKKQLLNTGTIATTTLSKDNYKMNQMRQWMNYCDQAKSIIVENYRQDSELCAELVRNIEREWISPAFVTLKLYSDDLTETNYKAVKDRFVNFLTNCGNMEYNSRVYVQDWISTLK